MQRELWRLIRESLRRLPRRRLRNAVYTDAEVLAVLLWAALHQRPVSWGVKRSSWPPQAWRRRLPDQSTMSRRLRDPAVPGLMRELAARIQQRLPPGRVLMTDGKAFMLENRTGDRDAANGRGSGRMARGYKLHVITDDRHRLYAWTILPLNHAEQPQTRALLGQLRGERRPGRRLLLGDAGYNSNSLFAAAREAGLRLTEARGGCCGGRWDGRRGLVDRFDDGVLIEVDGDEFAVVLAEFEPVEPELLVSRVRVPRAGLLLAHAENLALDAEGRDGVAVREGLGDADLGTDGVVLGGLVHGESIEGVLG